MHTENTSLNHPDLFWDNPEIWRELQSNFDYLQQFKIRRDKNILSLTREIAEQINSLDPVLEELCLQTCPNCDNPCCVRATVRYDFRDLLFLHSLQKAIPLGQPKPRPGRSCVLLGTRGCMLSRVLRPFICTWYLCPGQMNLVRSSPYGIVNGLPDRLWEVQKQRKELEAEFLCLICS